MSMDKRSFIRDELLNNSEYLEDIRFEKYEGVLPALLLRFLEYECRMNYHRNCDLENEWYTSIKLRFTKENDDVDVLFWWLKKNPEFIDLIIKKDFKEEFISLMNEKPEYFELVPFESQMGNHFNGFLLAIPSNIRYEKINDFKFNDPECYEGYVKWCKDIESNPESYRTFEKYYY